MATNDEDVDRVLETDLDEDEEETEVVDTETEDEEVEPEEEETTETEDEEETEGDETVESLKAKNAKLFARAKKAEGFVKKDGKWVKPATATKTPKNAKQPQLSSHDVLALAKADVHEDDLDEVIGYAGYRKISVAEALKDKTLMTIVSERAEERKTAEATNTRRQSRGGGDKTSGDKLLKDASQGTLPATEEGIDKLVGARFAAKGAK